MLAPRWLALSLYIVLCTVITVQRRVGECIMMGEWFPREQKMDDYIDTCSKIKIFLIRLRYQIIGVCGWVLTYTLVFHHYFLIRYSQHTEENQLYYYTQTFSYKVKYSVSALL